VNADRIFESLERYFAKVLEPHALAEAKLDHDVRNQDLLRLRMRA
jgi:hypothetical protein